MPTDEISKLKTTAQNPRRLSASCDEFNFFFIQMILRLEDSICLKIMTYNLTPFFERGHLFIYHKNDVVPTEQLNRYDLVSYWDGEQVNYALFLKKKEENLTLVKWNKAGKIECFEVKTKHYWARLPFTLSLIEKIKLRLFLL